MFYLLNGELNMFGKKKTFSNSIEYIVVGLGNPDRKYENTRHNAGFMMVDILPIN